MRVISLITDIKVNELAKNILRNESKIIKKHPPTDVYGKFHDGLTGLGPKSLTSRASHYNVLEWPGTKLLKSWIRKGYELYNDPTDKPLYVQCWANVMRKGEQIKSHKHEASSNVSGDMHLCGHLCVQVDGTTSTYYEGTPILNEEAIITFFPAYAHHWTDRYDGDSQRITIAFDILNENFYNIDIYDFAKARNHWIKI